MKTPAWRRLPEKSTPGAAAATVAAVTGRRATIATGMYGRDRKGASMGLLAHQR